MDRHHHEVELGKRFIVQIESTIVQDVDFGALENDRLLHRVPNRVYLAKLLAELGPTEPACHPHCLRMIGDCHVRIPAVGTGLHHVSHAVMPIRVSGVHLKVAADVAKLDQLRKPVMQCGVDFSPIFPKLRRDPGDANSPQDIGFLTAGDAARAPEYAVLVDLQSSLHAQRPYSDVVRLGTGKVM